MLTEIEEAAAKSATSLDDLRHRVWAEHAERLRAAQEQSASDFPRGVFVSLVSAIVGQMISNLVAEIPVVGTLAGLPVSLVGDRAGAPTGRRWVAAERAMHARLRALAPA